MGHVCFTRLGRKKKMQATSGPRQQSVTVSNLTSNLIASLQKGLAPKRGLVTEMH